MDRYKQASYLYTDGTLATVYEERRNGVMLGETVDIVRNYCTVTVRAKYDHWGTGSPAKGRLLVHNRYSQDGFIKLAKGGKVEAILPDLKVGSTNSQSRGLAVQLVKLTTKAGDQLSWTDIPEVIGSSFTPQIGDEYAIADPIAPGDYWAHGCRVMKVTDAAPKSKNMEVAA